MKRRLVSSAEAVPAKSQHKKPCSDCPWARAAINGWLGGNTAEEWMAFAHGESLVECHALTGVQCAGVSIYRGNVCKVPRDPTILRLPADRKLVFSNRVEFLAHHKSCIESKKGDFSLFDKLDAERKRGIVKSHIEAKLREIEEAMNDVEGDTTVSRDDYREFLAELHATIEIRLLGLDADDEKKGG